MSLYFSVNSIDLLNYRQKISYAFVICFILVVFYFKKNSENLRVRVREYRERTRRENNNSPERM